MSMPNYLPSRPTLLTTSALSGTIQEARPASVSVSVSVSANVADADPRARDATTPFFYILLSFIMVSLVFGLFPQF
jgi:hypothetical protein